MTFDAEWSRCAPWIQAALDDAENVYTLSDVEFLVRSGEAQFWPAPKSALVSRIQHYPRATWLTLWLAGGDLDEIRGDLVPLAEQYGVDHGCTKSVIFGRLGWSKALASDGYKALAMVTGKELAQ